MRIHCKWWIKPLQKCQSCQLCVITGKLQWTCVMGKSKIYISLFLHYISSLTTQYWFLWERERERELGTRMRRLIAISLRIPSSCVFLSAIFNLNKELGKNQCRPYCVFNYCNSDNKCNLFLYQSIKISSICFVYY